jgi:YT521-B-like domain/RNA recognition motif. (a.k.a. RRM, RBD, or RNP domain)
MILLSPSNTPMPSYRISRLEQAIKATRRPQDTKYPICRLNNSLPPSLTTNNINSRHRIIRLHTHNHTPPSIPMVRAMLPDIILISSRIRCDRAQTTISDPPSRLEVKDYLLEHCQQAALIHNLRVQVGSRALREDVADVHDALGLSRHSSESSLRTSVPRGPPRKPRQSGHALWVGNLPPSTQVADLKDHFSRNATKDIESVFLISKSNCAFVNYKTESACADAMVRFHDSRFQGVRLVCRLRRGSAPTSSGAPVNQSFGIGATESQENVASSTTEVVQQVTEPEEMNVPTVDGDALTAAAKVKEKFFVVKSLTVEDLELSVRTGIWATQAHNEASLNKAYQVSVFIGFLRKVD